MKRRDYTTLAATIRSKVLRLGTFHSLFKNRRNETRTEVGNIIRSNI